MTARSLSRMLCGLFVLAACTAAAQDSTNTSTASSVDSTSLLDRIQVSMGGAHYYHFSVAQPRRALTDPYLTGVEPEELRLQSPGGRSSRFVSDSPLYHGAGYLSVAAHVFAHDGVRIWGELVGEHRGSSYGIGDTRNMAVIPRFRFTFDTSATVFGERFRFGTSVGHMIDLRFGEGLTLYNMDAIGATIWVDWWKLRYYYEKIGDGYLGIGLNVGDFNQDGIELRDLELFDGIALDARVGGWSFPYAEEVQYPFVGPRAALLRDAKLSEFGYDVALALENADSSRLYAELAIRSSEETTERLVQRSALVAGARHALDDGRLRVRATAEYRYYGGLFNVGFSNVDVRYREEVTDRPNTIGPHIYPLSLLDRPFSQWAVFTEYQDLKDVTGYTFRADARWIVWDRVVLRGDVDLNYIVAEGTDGMLYPFFDVGVGWEPFDGTSLVLSMTNRAMNLDKSYPTFYLYEIPHPSVTIRWNR